VKIHVKSHLIQNGLYTGPALRAPLGSIEVDPDLGTIFISDSIDCRDSLIAGQGTNLIVLGHVKSGRAIIVEGDLEARGEIGAGDKLIANDLVCLGGSVSGRAGIHANSMHVGGSILSENGDVIASQSIRCEGSVYALGDIRCGGDLIRAGQDIVSVTGSIESFGRLIALEGKIEAEVDIAAAETILSGTSIRTSGRIKAGLRILAGKVGSKIPEPNECYVDAVEVHAESIEAMSVQDQLTLPELSIDEDQDRGLRQ